MANETVIEINVKDEKFKAFAIEWEKLQTSIKSMSVVWKKLDDAATDAGNAAEEAGKKADTVAKKVTEEAKKVTEEAKKVTEETKKVTEETKKVTEETKKVTEETKKVAKEETKRNNAEKKSEQDSLKLSQDKLKVFKDLSFNTRNIALDLASGAKSLIAWAAVGAIGGFGLGALANSQAQKYKEATGYRVAKPSDLTAANTAFSTKYFEPQNVLNSIAEAQTDTNKFVRLANLIGQNNALKSPEEVLYYLDRAAAKFATQYKGKNLIARSQAADVLGISNYYSSQDLNRIALNPSDFLKQNERYTQLRKELDVPEKTAKQLTNLSQHMTENFSKVDASFTKAMVALAPVIMKVSDAFTTLLTAILDLIPSWVNDSKSLFNKGDNPVKGRFGLPDAGISEFKNFVGPSKSDLERDSQLRKKLGLSPLSSQAMTSTSASQSINEKALYIARRFMASGFNRFSSSGLAGGARVEDPELDPHKKEVGGASYGIFQFNMAKQRLYEKWAKKRNRPSLSKSSTDDQIDFTIWDLKYGSEQAAYQKLMNAKSYSEGSYQALHAYERPESPGATESQRYAYTQGIGKQMDNPYKQSIIAPYLTKANFSIPKIEISDTTGGSVNVSASLMEGASRG
jgi:outer membrane biosynthesis protein TonB